MANGCLLTSTARRLSFISFDVLTRSLAQAEESLQDLPLSNARLTNLVHRALTATDAWHQRARKLPAPLAAWCVISLVLNRSVSVVRWLDRLITTVCGPSEQPQFPKVTKEAVGRARQRLGVSPHAGEVSDNWVPRTILSNRSSNPFRKQQHSGNQMDTSWHSGVYPAGR